MIGEHRGTTRNQLNPNYDYEDSRNNIPMVDRDPSTGGIHLGMDGAGGGSDERRGINQYSSPHHRNYSRESMDPDGKRSY